MGWCSATDIVDSAIEMTDAVYEIPPGLNGENEGWLRNRVDQIMRPHVRAIADKLRNEDWDCESESQHYERFGPELTGLTDAAFRAKMANDMDSEEFAHWLANVWIPQGREVASDA